MWRYPLGGVSAVFGAWLVSLISSPLTKHEAIVAFITGFIWNVCVDIRDIAKKVGV